MASSKNISLKNSSSKNAPQRRHRSYTESHEEIIDAAMRLISEQGVGALSMSAVAQRLGIDRTTLYYHFKDRAALVAETRAQSSARLIKAFTFEGTIEERIDYTTRYVLENPELTKLWIDDFIAVGDIRDNIPQWDALIEGFRDLHGGDEDPADPEIYFVNVLTSAVIGPRVFKNKVCPDADIDTIVHRFRLERMRMIRNRV
jgi:AcrR family transcriptional regulator